MPLNVLTPEEPIAVFFRQSAQSAITIFLFHSSLINKLALILDSKSKLNSTSSYPLEILLSKHDFIGERVIAE